jgi:hypothetical protein
VNNDNSFFLSFLKTSWVLMSVTLLILGCGKKESEIAKQIDFTATGPEFVLPNSLKNEDPLYYTCLASGSVTGPRVRVRKIGINWTGQGKLLPLVIRWSSKDPKLEKEFNYALSSGSGGTLSAFFGLTTDYIPEASGTISSEDSGIPGTTAGSRCYLDISALPKLKKPITGTATVTIHGTLSLSAIQELADGTQTPVVKEAVLDVIYFEGSVPIN